MQWPSVLIRDKRDEDNRDTQKAMRRRRQRSALCFQERGSCWSHQIQKEKEGLSPGAWACQCIDFGLGDSGAVRKCTSVVLFCSFWVICYSSPRKLTQPLLWSGSLWESVSNYGCLGGFGSQADPHSKLTLF